ncbi:hypothetical protein CERSUDRAFT_101904 [Gelatoporia subvermispora B]|uniref:Uncharacterized protein n=1 Tax=Ceriporiopsis subvermispora (strain B) TaxID=914234 RepID=M2QWI8_CERS8|nr:hypothetical protein CERSUDRAFT_101904 [Gelatoporia subvermispora B]
MWCTRWYLPLVLLPFPVAPPYFLLLFLFSTSLRARPCFYCIILLSATFMTSCYWPPVPLDTPLARPWSENVTTFADALTTLMSALPDDKKPTVIPIAERCWCDVSARAFFEPFNVTQWELNSLLRLKADLERKMRPEEEPVSVEGADSPEETQSRADAEDAVQEELPQPPQDAHASLFELVWPFSRKSRGLSKETTPISATALNATVATEEPTAGQSQSMQNTTQRQPITLLGPETAQLSYLRREYDLRPLGFGVILDFGWTPSKA